jgi:hypothetical protein
MKSIVNVKTNQVAFGEYKEPLDLNVHDYILHDFFGKKCSKLKTKKTYHKFSFVTVNDGKHIFALGIVDIFFVKNVFVYYYDINKGMIMEKQFNVVGKGMQFDDASHICRIKYKTKQINIDIDKNTIKGIFNINFKYHNDLEFKCEANLSEKNKPLRVVNPADFEH